MKQQTNVLRCDPSDLTVELSELWEPRVQHSKALLRGDLVHPGLQIISQHPRQHEGLDEHGVKDPPDDDPGDASPTARFFHRNITEGNAVFWTLDRNGELIGELYAFLKLEDRDFADGKTTAYLCAFRVRKEYRGLRLGSRMMKTVLDDLRSKGFRRATIGVGVSEERNRKMYSRLGFRTTIKTCHTDPCAMDGNMQPAADAEGFLLLSKAL